MNPGTNQNINLVDVGMGNGVAQNSLYANSNPNNFNPYNYNNGVNVNAMGPNIQVNPAIPTPLLDKPKTVKKIKNKSPNSIANSPGQNINDIP